MQCRDYHNIMITVIHQCVCVYIAIAQLQQVFVLGYIKIQYRPPVSTTVPAGEPLNTIRSCQQLLQPKPSVTDITFVTETLDRSSLISHAHHDITNLCCYTELFIAVLFCNALSK